MNSPALPCEPTENRTHSTSILESKAGSNGKNDLEIMLGLTFELSLAEEVYGIPSSKWNQQQDTPLPIYQLCRWSNIATATALSEL